MKIAPNCMILFVFLSVALNNEALPLAEVDEEKLIQVQARVSAQTIASVNSSSSTPRGGKATKAKSRTYRTGLPFPPGRVYTYLKEGKYAAKIGRRAPIYLSAVLESLTIRLGKLAAQVARNNKKIRIYAKDLATAVKGDRELYSLLSEVELAMGGKLKNRRIGQLLEKEDELKFSMVEGGAGEVTFAAEEGIRFGGKTRVKTNKQNSFAIYINNVVKKATRFRVDARAIAIMNTFIEDVLSRISKAAGALAKGGLLSFHEIEKAVLEVFPTNLAGNAVKAGKTAITKYQ